MAVATAPTADLLVVGLGNPGSEYEGTRHNVGVAVVELLAERHGGRLRARGHDPARVDRVTVDGHRLALAVPKTYMNESGQAVRPLVRRFGIEDLERLVIVHDELDLPPGRMKVKQGGGLAGHNGLRSVRDHLHSADFVRIRIGVGKPPNRAAGAGHVLNRPPLLVREQLGEMIDDAADAVEVMLTDGVAAAMERYNSRT